MHDSTAQAPQVTQESTGWSQVPHWLLSKVKPMSVVVYAALAQYAGLSDGCRPAIHRVAADLDCSRSSVERAIRELADVGALSVEHRFEGNLKLPSRYHLKLTKPTCTGDAPPVTGDATLPSPVTYEEDSLSKTKTTTVRKRPSQRLPEDWAPSPSHHLKATQRGLDIEYEAEQMRLWAQSKDERKVDWDAAFSGWLGRANGRRRNVGSTVKLDVAPGSLPIER